MINGIPHLPISTLSATLTAHKEKGTLTEELLLHALQNECRNDWCHLRNQNLSDLDSDYYFRTDKIERLFKAPITLLWIMDNLEAFEALPMPHGTFVESLLSTRYTLVNNEYIAARVAFEIACHPAILRVLHEAARWRVLKAVLRKYAARVSAYWMREAALTFGDKATREFVLRLLGETWFASAFVAAPDANIGWALFDTPTDLTGAMACVAIRAPVDLLVRTREIATRFGEMVMGVPTDDNWATLWDHSDSTTSLHDKYGPVGQEHADMLVLEAESSLFLSNRIEEGCSLSERSTAFLAQLNLAKPDKEQIAKLGALLISLPDSMTARVVVDKLRAIMTEENAHLVYRWALSAKQYIREVGDRECEPLIKQSWGHGELRKAVEARGWRFLTVVKRENSRAPNGYDLQVVVQEHGPRVVVTQEHWVNGRCNVGSVHEGSEVLIPPPEQENLLGHVVHQGGNIVIRRARLHPAEAVSYDMRGAFVNYSVYPQ